MVFLKSKPVKTNNSHDIIEILDLQNIYKYFKVPQHHQLSCTMLVCTFVHPICFQRVRVPPSVDSWQLWLPHGWHWPICCRIINLIQIPMAAILTREWMQLIMKTAVLFYVKVTNIKNRSKCYEFCQPIHKGESSSLWYLILSKTLQKRIFSKFLWEICLGAHPTAITYHYDQGFEARQIMLITNHKNGTSSR